MSDEPRGQDPRVPAMEDAIRRLAADVAALQAEVAGLKGGAARVATEATAPPSSLLSSLPSSSPSTSTPPVLPLPLRKPAGAPSAEPTPAGPPFVSASPDASQPAAGPAAAPPPRPSAKLPPRATVSGGVVSGGVEQAIGRYGTLAVATLAILLGVGAFLQWAVARGLLTPVIRVALGAVAAVVLAGLGLWLRGRGSRTFGNALLAISLAVVHLVAWGAGPVLGIVPPMLALGAAAVASAALASLALREGEEFLFILGLGGALLAPFVTMRGEGGPLQLLLFGGVVLSAAILALRDETWRIAPRLLTPFALWYMTAAASMPRGELAVSSVYWPTTFAFALALVGLGIAARTMRREIVKGMLLLVVLGLIIAGGHRDELPWTGIVYAVLGTLTAHALRRRIRATESDAAETWVEVVGMPLLFMLAALFIEDVWRLTVGPWIAGAWLLLTTPYLWIDPAAQRPRHLTVMLMATLAVVASIWHGQPTGIIPAFAVVAALGVVAFDRVPGKALFLPIGLALGLASVRVAILVSERVRWEYTPFLNQPALLGAVVVAAWGLFSFVVPRPLAALDAERKAWEPASAATSVMVLGPLMLFLWIRAELAYAYSRDLATFLLITYYSLVGVGTLLLGRRREVDALRQTGLALSLFAAFKAGIGANDLGNIGLRVGSYLVVGVFVLGVGYLYRAAPAEEASTT